MLRGVNSGGDTWALDLNEEPADARQRYQNTSQCNEVCPKRLCGGGPLISGGSVMARCSKISSAC